MSNIYDFSTFKNDLNELRIVLSDNQIEQLVFYYEQLVEWNEKINLTAITDFNEVMKKHFIDSLSLVKTFDFYTNRNIDLIDVGTGAGFPGLVLKIAFPDLNVTLLDSLNKRVIFLNSVIDNLGLQNITAIHGRAEDLAKNKIYREKYDLCVSRAVANLSTLSEYCIPFVKVGGQFISYKSAKAEEEIDMALSAVSKLGGDTPFSMDFLLPGSEIYRMFVLINKKKSTPIKYPRKAGTPLKEPLK